MSRCYALYSGTFSTNFWMCLLFVYFFHFLCIVFPSSERVCGSLDAPVQRRPGVKKASMLHFTIVEFKREKMIEMLSGFIFLLFCLLLPLPGCFFL